VKTLIVVLNWNGREMTKECIRHLLAMRGETFQILLVDNGSHDGSVEYLREVFPQVQVIANSRNLGFAAGCNLGMRQALDEDFEYVLLVNNDTAADPGLLAELLAEAQRHPRSGMVSPKIYYFEPSDRIWWAGGTYNPWLGVPEHVGLKKTDTGKAEETRVIDWATGCVLLLRCAALRETGLFDEQIFGNGEDLDLSLRMRRLGWSIRYTPRAKLWHKEGFDYRRNVGEYVRKFTATRNILWVMHKHARPVQWVTFLPYFLVRYVSVTVVMSLCRGDVKSALGALAGVRAFWRMRHRPDSAVLPAELTRPTRSLLEDTVVSEHSADGHG
jgi:GT2 family glycosyltransferase